MLLPTVLVASPLSAAAGGLNSQTMPLLAPARNIDPNPSVGGGGISVVGGSALLPEEGPSGTAADIEEWPTSSQVSVYIVRSGDTLAGIAKMFDVSSNTILWANNIQGGVIHPGDTLVILPITGLKHTVVAGETLATLAKKFKANAGDIAQYNGLDPAAKLAVGMEIIIPNGEIGATQGTPGTKKPSKNIKEPYLGGGGPELSNFFAWPVAGGIITQGLHGWNAIDIGAPRGTHILAAADGIVIVARSGGGWNGGYGNYVVVQHDNGTQTLYSHASKVLVSAGDSVSQGDTIALVGTTGLSTGPHVHFEVRGAANPFAQMAVGSGN